MKFAQPWTWRTPLKTISFGKGMECPAEALDHARQAGVLIQARTRKSK